MAPARPFGQRLDPRSLAVILLVLIAASCGKAGVNAPPPLRPAAETTGTGASAVAKDDCEPTDPADEDPAKSYDQRSIPEAEKLARSGMSKLRGAESREVDGPTRDNLLVEAVDDFITALIADPYNVNATYNLAAAYARIGRQQCTINFLKRLLQMRTHPSKRAEVESRIDRLLGRKKQALDADFNGMRRDVRFRVLIERMCEGSGDVECVMGSSSSE
jgi:hypothetical protein